MHQSGREGKGPFVLCFFVCVVGTEQTTNTQFCACGIDEGKMEAGWMGWTFLFYFNTVFLLAPS